MPFSDLPPFMVFPDDAEWRDRAFKKDIPEFAEFAPEGWYFCNEYEPRRDVDDQSALSLDVRFPRAYACNRRNPMGVRDHNWCYRCPAGLSHVQLHIYDAERERDRAMRL